MKISYFNNIKSVSPLKTVSVFKVLDEIKNGKHKELISNVRLYLDDKEKRNKEKQKLPYVTFSGKFETRAKDKLIKSSGIAVLDFDDVDDLQSLKENINTEPYTMASFVSPSANGLKVLVKIPPVDSDKHYKEFYSELRSYFNQYHETDQSTKDISRATYLSYDPDLYLNVDSEMFTDRKVEVIPKPKNVVQGVRLNDQNKVAERLLVWFRKKWTSGINRNNNLFILCSAFNDYGVDKSIALDYCMQYQSTDFSEREIQNLVKSAYKKTENFGTKFFEDKKKVKTVEKMLKAGVDQDSIKKRIGSENIDDLIEKISDEIDTGVFWEYDEKGKIKISSFRFDTYLKNKGIAKYFQDKESAAYDFISKDDSFINWIDTNRIKDIVKKDLISQGYIDIWDEMASNTRYFTKEYLNMLSTIDVKYKTDTKNESFIFYKNYAVKTTKDKIQKIPYSKIDNLIWRKQVIDREIQLKDNSEGVFKSFIWFVSGQDVERYYTLKSVIGYLLHSYQNDAKPKTIIFNDEMISDDIANGGSGKGLIHKAIGYIKNVVVEDGKRFDPKGQFAYQKVNKDSQIFLLDDVPPNFNYEFLFSVATEGMTVEKKGKDAFKIAFKESPKLSITTNYTIKGDGPSFKRRVFEVELANYFNDKHTPEDEFKHQFFNDWDKEEWAKFDNFMIRCIQYYLKNGLVESKKVNLDFRKLKNEVGAEFLEFMDGLDLTDYKIDRKELRDNFNNAYKNVARYNTAQKFNKKVKKYCDYYNIGLEESKYNGLIYFYFSKSGEKKEEDEILF